MNLNHNLIALNYIPGMGPRTLLKVREHWPNLDDFFAESKQSLLAAGFPLAMVNAIKAFNFKTIEPDLEWAEKPGQHILTIADEIYPTLLKEIYDPPMVLYLKGDPTVLTLPSLGVVGSRNPSIAGLETARKFAYEIAGHNIAIVSGLALGIDAQAHIGCILGKGKTIAVMATGIDRIYPYRHRDLAQEISENGLIISEFPLKTLPKAGHFPRRNRIISGLSLAILVVEAAIKSGSLITARYALEQNRDVFAIPGSIQNPQARGCHYLLQQGAKLVTSSADVLEELGVKTLNASPVHTVARDYKNLVKFVGFEITAIDQIIERSGMKVEEVIAELADLELNGVVKAVAGGYMRCA